jgi:radical SAM protein with 4Fe4S-binding SPASM domain
MCLVSYRPPLDRVNGSLDLATFQRLVDDLPDLEKVTLQGLGEPLLAPHLFEMIRYAAARGVRTGFNTNGTVLTRDKAERLVDAGLHWLHVSLDGATPETYESIRRGADFAKVRRNVLGLMDVIRRNGASLPHVSLVFVAMRRNLRELPDLVRLTADWGVGTLRVQNLSHSFSDTDPSGDYADIRAFSADEALWERGDLAASRRVFAAAEALARELDVDLRLPHLDVDDGRVAGTGRSPGCDWPWRSAYVTHDGEVQPCCMVMGADRAVLGDTRVDRFADVWRNEAYQAFRAALLTDEPPDVCAGCSMYRGVF